MLSRETTQTKPGMNDNNRKFEHKNGMQLWLLVLTRPDRAHPNSREKNLKLQEQQIVMYSYFFLKSLSLRLLGP